MNIAREFVTFLEDNSYGTFGTDIFIGTAPEDVNACYWVLSAGGNNKSSNQTSERLKNYSVNLFYRNTDQEAVYENLQALEELINSDNCTQIGSYETIEIEAILFPTDQDLDVQDRAVGLLGITLTIHA